MILTIDSGANLGWAIFEDGELTACGLSKSFDPGDKTSILHPAQYRRFEKVQRIVIERPHAGRTRARAKDILTLAIRAGECGGVLRYFTQLEPEYIEPGKWKGSLDKKICNRIVENKLGPEEKKLLANIRPASAKHNVLDAVGIGLWAVGRFI